MLGHGRVRGWLAVIENNYRVLVILHALVSLFEYEVYLTGIVTTALVLIQVQILLFRLFVLLVPVGPVIESEIINELKHQSTQKLGLLICLHENVVFRHHLTEQIDTRLDLSKVQRLVVALMQGLLIRHVIGWLQVLVVKLLVSVMPRPDSVLHSLVNFLDVLKLTNRRPQLHCIGGYRCEQ